MDELGAVVRKPDWFPTYAEEYVELIHATFTSFTFGFIDDMVIQTGESERDVRISEVNF